MTHRPGGFHAATPRIMVRDGAAATDHDKRALGDVEYVRKPGPDAKKIKHACIGIGDSPRLRMHERPET